MAGADVSNILQIGFVLFDVCSLRRITVLAVHGFSQASARMRSRTSVSRRPRESAVGLRVPAPRAASWLQLSRALLAHGGFHSPLHFLPRHVLLVGSNRPHVTERIGEGSGSITIELILHRPQFLGAGGNCLAS